MEIIKLNRSNLQIEINDKTYDFIDDFDDEDASVLEKFLELIEKLKNNK